MSGKVHALAGAIGERERQVIHAVVDEIMAAQGEDFFLSLMPITQHPSALLIHEKISGFGGMTGERTYGEPGKAVNSGSSQMKYFDPGAYQEHVRFSEREILKLRQFGSIGERGVKGLSSGQLDQLSRDGMKLKKRLNNRLNKLAVDAIMTGQYVYKGQTTSFDVPSANALTPASAWSTPSTSTPLQDLWTLQSTNPYVIKYVVKEWVVNPKTALQMLISAEVRNALKNYNLNSADLNVVSKLLFPGLAPIRIVKDSWQDESYDATGKVTLGNTTFFMPDNKVLMVPDLSGSMYPQFGEVQITQNMNDPSASLENPAQGLYTFVDEKGLENREAPYIKVVAGFNGGANLLRGDDVFTVTWS